MNKDLNTMSSRVEYLDGHRGLAILLVIGFHAYSRWPKLVPYGDEFANIFIFKAGKWGVELFFLISGFVILMTLEKCSNFKEFIYRRWLRLFPAMLTCSLLIFFSATYFYERPAGLPSFGNLLPGLTFTEASWWNKLFGFSGELEGAFWSLYVEFKFYIFAAFVYFWKGEKRLIYSLMAVYTLTILVNVFNNNTPNKHLLIVAYKILTNQLSFDYFGWFASGSTFYLFHKTGDYKWFWSGFCIAIICSVFIRNLSWEPGCILISLFFSLSIINKNLQRFLSQKILLTFGFISYPLYLIHENMMISMIIKIGNLGIEIPKILFPMFPILILSLIAYCIAAYCEPFIKLFISNTVIGIKNIKKSN